MEMQRRESSSRANVGERRSENSSRAGSFRVPRVPRNASMAALTHGEPQSMLEAQMEAFFGKVDLEDQWPTDPVEKAKIFNNTTKKQLKLSHRLVAAPLMPFGGDIDVITDVLKQFLTLAKTSNVVIMRAVKRFFRAVQTINRFLALRKKKRDRQVALIVEWWCKQEVGMREEMRKRALQPNYRIHSEGQEAALLEEYQRVNVPDDLKREVASMVYLRQRLAAAKLRRDWRLQMLAAVNDVRRVKRAQQSYHTLSDAQREALRHARQHYLDVAMQCPKEPQRVIDTVTLHKLLSVRSEVMQRRSKVARSDFLRSWEEEREIERKKRRELLQQMMKKKREEFARKKRQEQLEAEEANSAHADFGSTSLVSASTSISASAHQARSQRGFSVVDNTAHHEQSFSALSRTTSMRSVESGLHSSDGARNHLSGKLQQFRYKSQRSMSSHSLEANVERHTSQFTPALQSTVQKLARGKRKLFSAITLASAAPAPISGTFSATADGGSHRNDDEIEGYLVADLDCRTQEAFRVEKAMVAEIVSKRKRRQPPPSLDSFIGASKKAAAQQGFVSGFEPYNPRESNIRLCGASAVVHTAHTRRTRAQAPYNPAERSILTSLHSSIRNHTSGGGGGGDVLRTNLRPCSAAPQPLDRTLPCHPRESGSITVAELVNLRRGASRGTCRPASAKPFSSQSHGSSLNGGVERSGTRGTRARSAMIPTTRPSSAANNMSIESIKKVSGNDQPGVHHSSRAIESRIAAATPSCSPEPHPDHGPVEHGGQAVLYDFELTREIRDRHAASLASVAPETIKASFVSHRVKRTAVKALSLMINGSPEVQQHKN